MREGFEQRQTTPPFLLQFEMAVAFAGTPGDHFSAAMNSAKLSIGEADEEKQMMMDSSSAAQLLSVQVGEKDGLTHAFFRSANLTAVCMVDLPVTGHQ